MSILGELIAVRRGHDGRAPQGRATGACTDAASMILAHIAGVPVEETLLAFAPVGVTGVGVWLAGLAHRARKALRNR